MKKTLIALVLGLAFVAPSAHAQVATTTAPMEGHRIAALAGTSDSIRGKGRWLLLNVPVVGQLLYVDEHPELLQRFNEVMKAFYRL